MNQHLSRGRTAASRVAARASLRAAAARGRVDALNARFAERSAELRRRLSAGRAGEPDDAGLESIEVVVLSVVSSTAGMNHARKASRNDPILALRYE